MLLSIVLDGDLFFFSEGPVPELDLSHLFLLVFFDLLTFFLEYVLVELDDIIVDDFVGVDK